MEFGAAGGRPALEPIAARLAGTSLKLIALRRQVETGVSAQTAGGIEAVLAAMDGLL